jgi:hypothetical protein
VTDVLRLLIWNLADSKTTLEELREHLPPVPAPDAWISNDASERFGLVSFGATPEAELARVRELIGKEPDVLEEFDVE